MSEMTPEQQLREKLIDRVEAAAAACPGWWDDGTPPRAALDLDDPPAIAAAPATTPQFKLEL